MIRRSRTFAVAAVLSLAACTDSTTPAPVDAKAVLAASTAGLSVGNYRFTAVMPDARIEGVTDFASRSAAWTTTYHYAGRMDLEMRLIGPDQYTRARHDATSAAEKKKELRKTAAATDDPGTKADVAAEIREIDTGDSRYRHLDLSRIPERAAAMGLNVTDPDRTGATRLLPWARDATVDGATIRGTLVVPGPLGGSDALALISQRLVGTLAFTASIDERGRLSRLEIDLPASQGPTHPAGRWTLTVDGYGTTPAPERPTAIKETPEDTYRTLRS